jgi:acetolactate synthase-1/2/3 large subunit
MNERNGGDVVHEALHHPDVAAGFAVASIHNLPILDAIDRRSEIRIVDARHKQGAAHAADGCARSTGRLGVAITSTGPGAANAARGLFEAVFASSGVFMLTGQVESRFAGTSKGYIHRAERQLAML